MLLLSGKSHQICLGMSPVGLRLSCAWVSQLLGSPSAAAFLPCFGKELQHPAWSGRWGVLECLSLCPRGQQAGLGAGEGPSSA